MGAAVGTDLTWQSPASPRFKKVSCCCPARRMGATVSQNQGLGGRRQSCQLGADSSHQHGAQPPSLKIASGALLKMLTLQLTFGRSWQPIKPKLKIGAAGRAGWAPGSRDPHWLGRQGPKATGLGDWLLATAVPSAWPKPSGYPVLCWKDMGGGGGGRRQERKQEENRRVEETRTSFIPNHQILASNQTSRQKDTHG